MMILLRFPRGDDGFMYGTDDWDVLDVVVMTLVYSNSHLRPVS